MKVIWIYDGDARIHAYRHNNFFSNLDDVGNLSHDEQVVVVNFDDGVRFEILTTFVNTGGSYTIADSNNGGSWWT